MSTAGRPARTDSETLNLALRLLRLHEVYSVPVPALVKNEGLSQSRIYELLNIGRAHRAGEPEAPMSEPEPEPAAPPLPRKMTATRLLSRAWAAYHQGHGLQRLLSVGMPQFWTEVLLEIRAASTDGLRLSIGEPGDVHASRAALAAWFGHPEADLQQLIDLKVIDELPGGGLAIPDRFDLIPPNKPPRGKAKFQAAGQRFMLHLVPPVSGGTRPTDSGPAGISPESGSGEMSGKLPVSPETDSGRSLARGLMTDDKDPESLSSVISQDAAGERDGAGKIPAEIPVEIPVEPAAIPVGGATPASPGVVELADDLATLAKLAKPPDAEQLGRVQHWLDGGLSAGTIRAIAYRTAGRAKEPLGTLLYFEKEMAKALEAQRRPADTGPPAAPAPAAPPAEPLSEADRALAARLKPSMTVSDNDRSECPFPPSLGSFKDAVANGHGALADRWLDLWGAWDKAGRPRSARPPDFTMLRTRRKEFEERLDEAEDALTQPAPD